MNDQRPEPSTQELREYYYKNIAHGNKKKKGKAPRGTGFVILIKAFLYLMLTVITGGTMYAILIGISVLFDWVP